MSNMSNKRVVVESSALWWAVLLVTIVATGWMLHEFGLLAVGAR
jgi:hypothetical protein